MNSFHRMLVGTAAFALLAGAATAVAQDVVLTRSDDGDLRAAWDGEEPTEFVLMTATIDHEGNVLEQTRGKTIVLKPGQDIDVGRAIVAGGGVAYDELRPVTDPVAYTPGRDGLPGRKYFVTNLPGLLDGVETPREGEVAAGPSGTGKTMGESEGENTVNDPPTFTEKDPTVESDDERAMPRVKTNTDRKRPGRTKAADADVGDRSRNVFHVVTLVPADESAPRVHVQPVILQGPAPSDEPDR